LIAPLAALALAVTTASAPTPTVMPDSIWRRGQVEMATYTVTEKGGPAHDCRIEIRLDMGATSMPGAEEKNEGITMRKTLSLTFDNRMPGSETIAPKVLVMFDAKSFRPMAELASRAVVPNAGEMLYDGLPAWLRGFDLTTPAQFLVPLRMMPVSSAKSDPVAARIEFLGAAGPALVGGRSGLQVDVRYDGKVDHLWFHPDPKHLLLVWEKADGTKLTWRTQPPRDSD
jgi:hypothetical protein